MTRCQLTELAFQIFVSGRPNLEREISIIVDDKERGLTKQELRFIKIALELEKEADSRCISPWDYQLKIVEDSGLDVSALRCEGRFYDADAISNDRLL